MDSKIITIQADITTSLIDNLLHAQSFKKILNIKVIPLSVTGAMSEVRKIQIQYDQNTQGISPQTIFIKFGRKLPPQHWITKFIKENSTYDHEVQAYQYLRKQNIKIIPKIYYINYNKNDQFTILMQDLTKNYNIVQQKVGVDLNITNIVMQEMGRFHAKFVNNNELKTKFQSYETFYATCNNFAKITTITEQLVQKMNKKFEVNIISAIQILKSINYEGTIYQDHMKSYISKINIPNLIQKHHYYFKQLLNQPKITSLLHCDLRCQNMLINENAVKIVDWQCTSVGSPLIDVAKFLIESVQVEVRQKQYKNFLSRYLKVFEQQSKIKLQQQFIKQSINFYLHVEMDVMTNLALYLKSFTGLENLKQRLEQKNRFLILTFAIVYRTIVFYVDEMVNNN